MKQKLSIAVSLIHDPEVIIFDEPTNGLDIITARSVTDYLLKLKDQGKIIIVSTHIMSVASKLCDRLGIILDGRFVAEGTLEEILTQTDSHDLEDAFFKLYENEGGNIHG
jgi:sodium transport system ATP-binding protein